MSEALFGGMLAWSVLRIDAPAEVTFVAETRVWQPTGAAAGEGERGLSPEALASSLAERGVGPGILLSNQSSLEVGTSLPLELNTPPVGRWGGREAERPAGFAGLESAGSSPVIGSAGVEGPAVISLVAGTDRGNQRAFLTAAGLSAAKVPPTPPPGRADGTTPGPGAPPEPPLGFEANVGQTNPAVRFLTRGPGYTLFLTAREAVLSFGIPASTGPVVHMQLVGGNPAPTVAGLDPLPGHAGYFLGSDTTRWHPSVPTFGQVAYRGVYPGIDLVLHGRQGQPKFDFDVAPGADPTPILLNFAGADRVRLDSQGNLLVDAGSAEISQPRPVLYQDELDGRHFVPGAFRLLPGSQVGFSVGAYDRAYPLVIDPSLRFSTYLGGAGTDQGWGVAADRAGNIYVTGFTDSPNFPGDPPPQNSRDVFVSRFSPDGRTLQYSAVLGGQFRDEARGIAVDDLGDAYVTGFTESFDFPTTPNAYQRDFPGGRHAFLTILGTNGNLIYSTYFGGPGEEEGRGVAVDGNRNAYLTGITSSSSNFITNADGLRVDYGGGDSDAFVAKFDPSRPPPQQLVYSTYIGGGGTEDVGFSDGDTPVISGGIAVDSAGNAFVTGTTGSPDNFQTTPNAHQPQYGGGASDAFVAEIGGGPQPSFAYLSYLGGGGDDQGHAVATDAVGNAYVTGSTNSPDFEVTPNAFQQSPGGDNATNAFFTKVQPQDTGYDYSTYLGGQGPDLGNGIAVTHLGHVYVTGTTSSVTDFPTRDALQPAYGGGASDAFVAKFHPEEPDPDQTLHASTYLGGPADDQGMAAATVPFPGGGSSPCPSGGPLAADGNCDDMVSTAGISDGPGFPTRGAVQPNYGGGGSDATASELTDCGCAPTLDPPQHGATGEVMVAWQDVGCGETIDHFYVEYWPAVGGSPQTVDNIPPGQIAQSVPGLAPGQDYYFQVVAVFSNPCCLPAASDAQLGTAGL